MKSSGQHGNQNTIRIFKEVNDFKAVEKLLRGSGIEIPEKYKERIAEGDKFVCTLDAHQRSFIRLVDASIRHATFRGGTSVP